jgi:protein-disulfide isomerase
MSKQSRIRTQELRKAQLEAAARKAKQRRIAQVLGGAVILGLVAAIVVAVINVTGGSDDSSPTPDDVVVPKNLTESGAFAVGTDDAPVTVEVYYDYMCPACGAFEALNEEELDRLVGEGVARVELRPVSFLDRFSEGTEYSTRTANAFATVVDGAPDSAWAFHGALYANQPEEGTEGLSDDEIADLATDAGVPADVVSRFTDGTFEAWVASVTDEATDTGGVQGTPTIKIDGEVFEGDWSKPGVLTEAIESAAGDQ